ncbi:MAG: glutamate synthase large subunit [Gemmiger sp.]|uniref:glutamate synthase large subunit n=1 Tax=Gemmiger sp. TaxID=2049027 RepID=UPI002E7A7CE1|nr:glutamate synthase large subunit [Gemmiger sp.]MEE0800911.1 glutamate synthase large subunit [Gemmiger sp.]
MENFTERNVPAGLYDPRFEHDNCGIGAVVDIKGRKSHKIIDDSLQIVEHLEHRAGKDAEGKTGDGVGILLQIGHKFFLKAAAELGIKLGGEREYGVGMFFFPQEELSRNQDKKLFEIICEKEGLPFLGWREVPTCPEILGHKARDCMPSIWQAFVGKPAALNTGIDFDRRLYVARRVFEQSSPDTYVCSLSSRTIVYKGMFLVRELRLFYQDLRDPDYESAIGMVHSRFSTNTAPSWNRAHPNRLILHNGEINTIRGNVDTMLAREETIESACLKGEMNKVLPIVNQGGSDSAMLDNTLEFLMMNGMELPLAVMVTIPEPWENNRSMDPKKRAFYQYYATMLEPWDGPASILFSDGDVMGACLDRNGLRPSRYYITRDGRLILSSEVGVLDLPADQIVRKDRLRPGKMLLVDTVRGELVDDSKLKDDYASRHPYGEWLDRNLVELEDLKIPNERVPHHTNSELVRLQKAFGYRYEDVTSHILPMARSGAEPSGAMGSDVPLAVLSQTHPPLFSYFHQMFAQVTNPPIDALREKVVTSTTVYVGAQGNLLEENADNCKVLKIHNPILTGTDLMKIRTMKVPGFHVESLSLCYYKNTDLEKAIERLFVEVDRAYRDGANILILSDRDIDEYHVAIPSLLAVSAVSKYLVRTRKRTAMALILESGEPRKVHDFATLLGYGACAVCPYLAQETVGELIEEGLLDKDYYAAVEDYNRAVLAGIVKIASKMGISTIQSYQGSQIFEALGISSEVIDKYFTNTVSRVGGITVKDIQEDLEARHRQAFDPLGLDISHELPSIGEHKFRSGPQAEQHLYNPRAIHLLQQACQTGDYSLFQEYTQAAEEDDRPVHLRSLLDFNYPDQGIPLDEVESVDSIVHRFKTAAMSYGALSEEAHECLAIAMNRLGGKSNTGEGGEAEDRFGTERNSAIKQVASARFGVTSQYLVSADEIQIKMAQGAKPGEGGQLPGGKVYPWVAKTRHSTPGVGLISPPPHHDIYSIEDLAQLIYDLKCANRRAAINVKLVSETGVGTIAAGVAKAGAEVILISGFDGGTGAASRNSIHNAGLPWELGIAEAHQSLILNGLRSRVRIEADSKLMSGRDVAIAAMLGAEEFGFGTGPLVAMGCVMMRVCNLDTCPMGICTQNPELRKNFRGKPEYVMNFMRLMAEDLRNYMARLGVRRVEDLVGRTDLLRVKEAPAGSRAGELDLQALLCNPLIPNSNIHYCPEDAYNFGLDRTPDLKVLMKKFKKSLESAEPRPVVCDVPVGNTDRAFGTIFGSEITRKFGNSLPDDTFHVRCRGYGGQSFGAFLPKGMTLELVGDSNDYLGKGLSGGQIIVYPPKEAAFDRSDNIIIGNVALYGATGGRAFISGVAGERFCVRNSGAVAVVEGVGDHGCEYMTGGTVVVLGRTGKNFAAGMSGGIAYVLDEDWDFYTRVNKDMVSLEPVEHKYDVAQLKDLIREHVEATGSPRGKEILEHFSEYLPRFKKVLPHDYDTMLRLIARMEEKGEDSEQAQIEAFYAMKNAAQ